MDSGNTVLTNSRLELYAWFFTRVSGILLLVLALWHVAIMHVFNVGQLSFDFVVARWGTPFWRSYDFLLLAFALGHGTNGMRTVIHDYVRRPRARVVVLTALYVIAFTLLVVGSIVLFTFNLKG